MMERSEEVLDYDADEAAKIIQREDGISSMMAQASAQALGAPGWTHPALFPLVHAWLRGEHPEFEFQGVTMAMIMKKKGPSYRGAIATMSWLLDNPDEVEWFKNHDFPVI